MSRLAVIAALFALGMGLRLAVINHVGAGHEDIRHFGESAMIVARGGNLYAEQWAYNYSPLWAFALAPLTKLPIPFGISYRVLISLLNFVVALLLYKLAPLAGRRDGLLLMAIYWLNPASIWMDGGIGQFDHAAMIPVLAGVLIRCRR